MIDVKTEIIKALRANNDLMNLLGGTTDKYNRIYQIKAPYADEFPRVMVYLLGSKDDDYFDNKRTTYNPIIQISLFMKEDYTFETMKIIDNVLIDLGYERIDEYENYENDTGCFHKAGRYQTKKIYER